MSELDAGSYRFPMHTTGLRQNTNELPLEEYLCVQMLENR